MIASRLFAVAVHALLHHDPAAVVGDHEAVQIKFKSVLHGGAVDLRHQAACGGEFAAVKADAIADGDEFVRRLTRMLAAPTTNPQAKLAIEWS